MRRVPPSLIIRWIILLNLTAVFLVLNLSVKETEKLEKNKRWLSTHNISAYSAGSLDWAINVLEERTELHTYSSFRTGRSLLNFTGTILNFFKDNNLVIENYHINVKDEGDFLLKANGNPLNIIRCIYDLSYSDKNLRITFLSITMNTENLKAELTMRVTYG